MLQRALAGGAPTAEKSANALSARTPTRHKRLTTLVTARGMIMYGNSFVGSEKRTSPPDGRAARDLPRGFLTAPGAGCSVRGSAARARRRAKQKRFGPCCGGWCSSARDEERPVTAAAASGDGAEGLLAALRRLDGLLARAVEEAERQFGVEAAGDPHRGLYVGREEVERVLRRDPGQPIL